MKLYQLIYIFVITLIITPKIIAQLTTNFARQFGSTNSWFYPESCSDIAIDNEGSIYSIGYYGGTFSSGSTTLQGKGGKDGYVQKFDNNGNLIWLFSLANQYDVEPYDIDIDSKGDIIIIGKFRGTIDFDPDPEETHNVGVGTENWHGFILKISKNSDFIWVKQFGVKGNSWHIYPTVLDIDKDDNIIIAGEFANTLEYGNFTMVEFEESMFVLKLTNNGDLIWGIKRKHGDILGSPGNISSDNEGYIYIGNKNKLEKFSPNGNLMWSKPMFVQEDNVDIATVIVDHVGHIYARAYIKTNGIVSGGLIKYNSEGDVIWSYHPDFIFGDLAINKYNELLIFSSLYKTQDVDPTEKEDIYTSVAEGDIYIQKMTPGGVVIKTTLMRADYFCSLSRIEAGEDGTIAICGRNYGRTHFKPEDSSYTLAPSDKFQGYVASYNDSCIPSFFDENIITCDTLHIGYQTITKSGTYFSATIGNDNCAKYKKYIVDISLFEKKIYEDDSYLSIGSNKNGQDIEYTWLNCADGTIFTGEIDTLMQVSKTGYYSVITDNGMCLDTSDCFYHTSIEPVSPIDISAHSKFGIQTAINYNWMAVSSNSTGGNVYLYKRISGEWIEKQIIPGNGNYFGNALAIDNDWLVIGAHNYDTKGNDSGSIFVYKRSGNDWTFFKEITASDGSQNDRFGYSVDIEGHTIVVGAPGHDPNGSASIHKKAGAAYVFSFIDGDWIEVYKMLNINYNDKDQMGTKVKISNSNIFVSSPGRTNILGEVGVIIIYKKVFNSNSWTVLQLIHPSEKEDTNFGIDFDIYNDKLAVVGKNSLYYFTKDDKWNQEQRIARPGLKISLSSMTLNDKYLAITNNFWYSSLTGVDIFKIQADTLNLYKNITEREKDELFGKSMSFGSDYLVITASLNDDNGEDSGIFYTFSFTEDFTITQDVELSNNTFKVFPNPSTNYIFLNGDVSNLVIYNTQGIIIDKIPNGTDRVDISKLNPGIYFISNGTQSNRFVKL